jgi:hypothetical protein
MYPGLMLLLQEVTVALAMDRPAAPHPCNRPGLLTTLLMGMGYRKGNSAAHNLL